jgi:hypothetical protein
VAEARYSTSLGGTQLLRNKLAKAAVAIFTKSLLVIFAISLLSEGNIDQNIRVSVVSGAGFSILPFLNKRPSFAATYFMNVYKRIQITL